MILQKVYRMMDNLGFAESTVGTRYIRDAVQMIDQHSRIMMTKDVYPALAKAYNTTPQSIERAMRHAIYKANQSPSWDYYWREYGGWNAPTNAEVVMRLAREGGFGED